MDGIEDDQELEDHINNGDKIDKNHLKDEIRKLKSKINTQGTISSGDENAKNVNNDLLDEIRDILADGADY